MLPQQGIRFKSFLFPHSVICSLLISILPFHRCNPFVLPTYSIFVSWLIVPSVAYVSAFTGFFLTSYPCLRLTLTRLPRFLLYKPRLRSVKLSDFFCRVALVSLNPNIAQCPTGIFLVFSFKSCSETAARLRRKRETEWEGQIEVEKTTACRSSSSLESAITVLSSDFPLIASPPFDTLDSLSTL